MNLQKKKIIPLLFALLGVMDFIYGMVRHDLISLGVGALMVGIAVYVFKKEGASAGS